MRTDIIVNIKNNKYYSDYLKVKSSWYKELYINPNSFNKFIEDVKDYYHLRFSDRLNKSLNTLDLITNIVSNLK